jgi:hypothetical protein
VPDLDDNQRPPVPGDGESGAETMSEMKLWSRDLEKSQLTRLKRTQASARVWLGVLTSFLGLLGSVVLFKGGDLVTGVTSSGALQAVLIVLVALVLGVTVLAIILGGQATWGGLADVTQIDAQNPGGDQVVGTAPDGMHGVTDAKPGWLRLWFDLANWLTLQRGGEEKPAQPADPLWKKHKDRTLATADRRRVNLHASRTTGVIAAGLIAVLAIVAVVAGTVAPVPTDVMVVHHGHVTCGPTSQFHEFTGVTEVIAVNSC